MPTAISSYDMDVQRLWISAMLVMPETENVDHFALLLLTASWLEDNTESLSAQDCQIYSVISYTLCSEILTQVETYATLPFYRSLAYLTREILAAMADELEEGSSFHQ